MITLLIPLIVAFHAVRYEYRKNSPLLEIFFSLFAALLLSGLVVGLINVFTFVYVDSISYPTREYWRCNIVSLRDDKNIQGDFTIGSGFINNKQVYYIYYKYSNNNEYRQYELEVNKTIIQETDNESPQLIAYGRDVSNYNRLLCLVKPGNYISQYQLKVPKNTIIKEFKVN